MIPTKYALSGQFCVEVVRRRHVVQAVLCNQHLEVYRLACERLGVEPDRCLYVGDGSSRELTGAREVGMTPVLIEAPHDEYFVDRQDAIEWKGPKIGSLSEVLSFVQ